jgi:hypothetical protein
MDSTNHQLSSKSIAIDESNNIYLHSQGSAGLQTVKLNSSGVLNG